MKRCLPLLLLCLGLFTPAVADERPAVTAADYNRFVERMVSKLEQRAHELQRHAFSSRLELMAAMSELTPDHMLQAKDAALAELHIAPAEMAAFMQAHPDTVITVDLEGRMERAMRPLAAKGEQLPKLDDLDGALARAKQRHKPVMIFFSAGWCIPCKEMIEKSFRDPRVLTALHGYEVAIVDFSDDESKSVQALKQQYAVETLPMLLVRQDGRERVRLDHFVRADELAAALTLPAQK